MPSAKRDLHRGFRFYERRAEIGTYFLNCLYSDVDTICRFGGIHRQSGDIFRFKSKKFPFWVYYRIDSEIDTAFVVAVLDARQAPGKLSWRESIEREKRSPGN